MKPKELTTEHLKMAYPQGFFPMPHPETEEILWYRPDPRAIIPLKSLHVSRSLTRKIERGGYEVTRDRDFHAVMQGCSQREETWILADFLRVYSELHSEGYAHSLEIRRNKSIVGGVYGVHFGAAFFAESMFHTETDASKIALYHLVEHLKKQGFLLLEVQFLTPHLKSLGAIEISDAKYDQLLAVALGVEKHF